MVEEIDFNVLADRTVDRARKWDRKLLLEKYPNLPQDIIPMWIADMDFPVAPEISSKFNEIVNNGAFGYTYAFDEFYESVINWHLRRNNITIEKEWITLSYGTVSTLHYLYQTFCSKEDSIIINTPVYDPFAYAAEHNHIKVICNKLIEENNRYFIDFEEFENQLKKYNPKLYVLCSPHNPSGRIWTKKEIKKLAKLCKENEVIMIVDEVHSEMVFENDFTSALHFFDEYGDNLIMVTSPNKAFNLGGLKTSYSIIPSDKLRNIFREKLKENSITSPNVFGVFGIIAAYNNSEYWLNELQNYINNNYQYTKKYIEQNIKEFQIFEMESSYLPWVDISNLNYNTDDFVADLAENTGVIVGSGKDYVKDGENFIRLNMGMSYDLVKESLKRIDQFVTDLNNK